jgi:FkbM family methyltransferase
MNPLLSISRFLLRNRFRGGTRLTKWLSHRDESLQAYRVEVPGGEIVIDLRNSGTHGLFQAAVPLSSEHKVMELAVRPNDVVFDIGANAGVFTVWLSSLVGPSGRVFSFEPNHAYRRSLSLTTELLSNVTFLPLALADSEGEVEFFVPGDDTMASLKDWTGGSNGAVVKTECQKTTIDNMLRSGKIAAADFIKCDIEGGEYDCFRGAMTLLDRTDAPIILFEANLNSTRGYGITISAAFDFLRTLSQPRFSFFHVYEKGDLTPIDEITFSHGNILACPESRRSRIT